MAELKDIILKWQEIKDFFYYEEHKTKDLRAAIKRLDKMKEELSGMFGEIETPETTEKIKKKYKKEIK